MQNIGQGGGIDIHSAHDEHIVSSPKHAAGQAKEAAPAATGIAAISDKIAGAIAQSWIAPTSQVCQDQLAHFTRLNRLAGRRVDNFRDKLAFVDMNPVLLDAGETE